MWQWSLLSTPHSSHLWNTFPLFHALLLLAVALEDVQVCIKCAASAGIIYLWEAMCVHILNSKLIKHKNMFRRLNIKTLQRELVAWPRPRWCIAYDYSFYCWWALHRPFNKWHQGEQNNGKALIIVEAVWLPVEFIISGKESSLTMENQFVNY